MLTRKRTFKSSQIVCVQRKLVPNFRTWKSPVRGVTRKAMTDKTFPYLPILSLNMGWISSNKVPRQTSSASLGKWYSTSGLTSTGAEIWPSKVAEFRNVNKKDAFWARGLLSELIYFASTIKFVTP